MSEAYDSWSDVAALVRKIVAAASLLKEAKTRDVQAHVSYCAVFARDATEYAQLRRLVEQRGLLANETGTGPVFVVDGIPTVAGLLRIVKIRQPDPSRTERGDADFAVANYRDFKRSYVALPGFALIEREEFEMIELVDSKFDARVYFSDPPVEEHAGIREHLTEHRKS